MNVIITGASGMVGEGVLHECLNDENVRSVLVVGRKECGHQHPKLKEIIHTDFFDLTPIKDELKGYDACYFCLGISSLGMKKAEYKKITYDLTLNFAATLLKANPEMTFCYVSGAGTDGTEKGRVSWARVKGKTENDILKLGFKAAFMFRPGFIKPTKGLKNTLKWYKYVEFLFPMFKLLLPGYVTSQRELGQAMIKCTKEGYQEKVLENKEINRLANS